MPPNTHRAIFHPPTGSSPMPTMVVTGSGHGQVRSPEFQPGLLGGWQGPRSLSHHLPPCSARMSRKSGCPDGGCGRCVCHGACLSPHFFRVPPTAKGGLTARASSSARALRVHPCCRGPWCVSVCSSLSAASLPASGASTSPTTATGRTAPA